jgi:hypothetical protein
VTAKVEGEILLQSVDVAKRLPVPGFGKLLERGVDSLDISRMVLVVMQFHDLAGDVGFQGAVVVRKIGQFVGGHSSPLVSLYGSGSQTDAHATTRHRRAGARAPLCQRGHRIGCV